MVRVQITEVQMLNPESAAGLTMMTAGRKSYKWKCRKLKHYLNIFLDDQITNTAQHHNLRNFLPLKMLFVPSRDGMLR